MNVVILNIINLRKSSSLFSYIFLKNLMHTFELENYVSYGLLVVRRFNENVLNVRKSTPLQYIFEENLMHGYNVHESLYPIQNSKSKAPGSGLRM